MIDDQIIYNTFQKNIILMAMVIFHCREMNSMYDFVWMEVNVGMRYTGQGSL